MRREKERILLNIFPFFSPKKEPFLLQEKLREGEWRKNDWKWENVVDDDDDDDDDGNENDDDDDDEME